MKKVRSEVRESARLWALNIKRDLDDCYDGDPDKVNLTLKDIAEALLALAGVEWQYVRRFRRRT